VTTDLADWNEYAVAAILEIFGGGGAPPHLLRIRAVTSVIRDRRITGAALARLPSVRATIELFARLAYEKLDNRWGGAARLIGELRYEPQRERHYRRLVAARGADQPPRGIARKPSFSALAMMDSAAAAAVANAAMAADAATGAAVDDAAKDDGGERRRGRPRPRSAPTLTGGRGKSLKAGGDARRRPTSALANISRETARVRPTPEVARGTTAIPGIVSLAQQHSARFEREDAAADAAIAASVFASASSSSRCSSGGSSPSLAFHVSSPLARGTSSRGAAGRVAALSASCAAPSTPPRATETLPHRPGAWGSPLDGGAEEELDCGDSGFVAQHRPPTMNLAQTADVAAALRNRARARARLERRARTDARLTEMLNAAELE
jgi:hypothetical protein